MSEGVDIELRCVDCGCDFLFTAGEQEYFMNRQLSQPKRCKECRRIKKEEREEARNKARQKN